MKRLPYLIVLIVLFGLNEVSAQWNANGNNIYNTNSGNVGIGSNSPTSLLHVQKNITEPTITIQNLGGNGGASFRMWDNASGADWKFKATNAGGFKIRDNSNLMDVITIEPNSFSNALYIKSTDNVGIGTASPASSALVDMTSTTKGLLPPRMTYAELMAISDPVNGLIVFCTDCGSSGVGTLSIFAAGVWNTLSTNCMNPGSPSEGTHVPSSSQIIWNWNTVAGATGYKWNTSNDYNSAENMSTLTSKTETGLTPATFYTRYLWSYNACGNSAATILTATTSAAWACSEPINITHVAGNVAPVSKTTTYGTVMNIPGEPGKCWITSNLGADHQASGMYDGTEASAGWYWQFNRTQGYKHDGTTRTPNSTWINPIDELSQWIIGNDPCNLELGNGWRLPTFTEWNNVDYYGGWVDPSGPWNSPLKIHCAGGLMGNAGNLDGRGWDINSAGYYWANGQSTSTTGLNLRFGYGYCLPSANAKSIGHSVRCIHE